MNRSRTVHRLLKPTYLLLASASLLAVIGVSQNVRDAFPSSIATYPKFEPACDTLNLTGVSSARWDCFKAAVALQMRSSFPNPERGQASTDDGTISYDYNRHAQTLAITVTSKPLWASCGRVEQRIREFLEDCRGSRVMRLADAQGADVWRIDEPNLKKPDTDYQDITFKTGDAVRIDAGGCVQTGGKGNTWRLYVDPRGRDSDRLYHGLVRLPGMATPMRIRTFVTNGNNYKIPASAHGDMTLHLGYEDDSNDYANNGYWGRDPGVDNQCVGIEKAWVRITIYRAK